MHFHSQKVLEIFEWILFYKNEIPVDRINLWAKWANVMGTKSDKRWRFVVFDNKSGFIKEIPVVKENYYLKLRKTLALQFGRNIFSLLLRTLIYNCNLNKLQRIFIQTFKVLFFFCPSFAFFAFPSIAIQISFSYGRFTLWPTVTPRIAYYHFYWNSRKKLVTSVFWT